MQTISERAKLCESKNIPVGHGNGFWLKMPFKSLHPRVGSTNDKGSLSNEDRRKRGSSTFDD